MTCACQVVFGAPVPGGFFDERQTSISYCPKHQAVDQLLEAAKRVEADLRLVDRAEQEHTDQTGVVRIRNWHISGSRKAMKEALTAAESQCDS